ncbi:ferredoxin family protein [Paradesulfitobacterium aromaticivorans]
MENKVIFAEERCKGCGLCMTACPKGIIEFTKHLNTLGYHPASVVNQSSCTSCGNCYRMCPDQVITVRKEEKI